MSIIYSYPIKGAAVDDDLILISDSASTPKFATKQVRVSGLPFSNNQGTVTSVGVSMPSAFAVAGSPITSSGTIAVTTTGGNVGQFLAHDGTWGTPAGGAANPAGSTSEIQYNNGGAFGASPDFSYASSILRVKHTINVLGQGNGNPAGRIKLHCENSSHGVTLEGPAHAGNNSYLLKFPSAAPANNQILEYTTAGSLGWIATPSGGGGTTYTAGDGLQLNATTFSTDLKENGGLVIESNELALDLSASSIQGTLATSDGGTGSSNTEYCDLTANVTGILPVGKGGTGVNTLGASRLILGNGTSAVTSISSQTKGTIVVGDGITTNILGVGTDGHVLTAASGDATGVRWTAATVSASDISSGTLSVDNGGTGANYDPTAGGVIFGNANEDGYAQASGLSYVAGEYSLKVVSTGNAYPSGLFENPNVTSAIAGGGNGTYTSSIGALNVFNNSAGQTNGATAIAVAGSDNIANSKGRLMSFYMASHLGAGLERVGDITADRGTGTVAFANVSDYRLKENVVSLPSSTNKIKALNPVSYNMIGFDKVVEGFLAHELQAEFPDAVTGEKDAVDSDGNINPQMVDYTKIIPTLVGAIKELTARIEALEA